MLFKEPHEKAHLLGRTVPVLPGEGVERQVLDPEFPRVRDDVPCDLYALAVAVYPGEELPARPAAVAVHYYGDVPGELLPANILFNLFHLPGLTVFFRPGLLTSPVTRIDKITINWRQPQDNWPLNRGLIPPLYPLPFS